MATPEMFEPVEFNPGFDPGEFVYDYIFGFHVDSRNVVTRGLTRVLGFGAPLAHAPGEGFDTSGVVRPLVDFDQLPDEHRTADKQGKGIGPRMYNTPQAVLGLDELPDTLGVYTFEVDQDEILDLRNRGKLATVARHAMVIASTKLTGLDRTTRRIHDSYGNAPAVLFEQPPHARLRQAARGAESPVAPEFMIIRDPDTELHKVGQYAR